jgi:hypothetical protein
LSSQNKKVITAKEAMAPPLIHIPMTPSAVRETLLMTAGVDAEACVAAVSTREVPPKAVMTADAMKVRIKRTQRPLNRILNIIILTF